jgi:multicomponent Na+:H+ antiporter subunit G
MMWLGYGLIFLGVGVCVIGSVGMLRFHDLYTRSHAASLIDTLGATLVIAGLAFLSSSWIIFLKLCFLVLFLVFSSPTATHALAQAALHGGQKPRMQR